MATFLAELLVAFSDARLFNDLYWERKDYPVISLGEAARLFGAGEHFMVIFDPKWKAKIRPYDHQKDKYNVLNVPYPLARFRGGSIQTIDAPELGRTIRVCREAVLDAQCEAGNKDEERIVDKVLRIQRKHVSKDALVYDLKTGAVVREDTCSYWFSPDMARRSREEDDLYLQIGFYHDEGNFWGYEARPG